MTAVNNQLKDVLSTETAAKPLGNRKPVHQSCSLVYLACKVSSKLKEGDFRGAVKLACSYDSFADQNDASYAALYEKHPALPPAFSTPLAPTYLSTLLVCEVEVVQAIRSSP